MIIEVSNVLVSTDILSENFCCDLTKCKGKCCIEGDAGAPVTTDEIMEMEDALDKVWPMLSASAQAVIDQQGVSYIDQEGDLVTSIVGGKDCVFTYYDDLKLDDGQTVSQCCLCAFERLYREGRNHWCKPISCALYPIRVKTLSSGQVALNYNRWQVCREAVAKGNELHLPVYKFLREPLIRRFGKEWYEELDTIAGELSKQGLV